MTYLNSIEAANVNTLEVHYYFDDSSHSMDANALNRCDYELLAIIREVANILSVHVTVETEPIGEGGIKKWLKILSKEEGKKAVVTTAVITVLLTNLLATPIGKLSEKLVEKFFEDTEMTELQKEKLRNEIRILKSFQAEEQLDSIASAEANTLIKKRRSNFYESLATYPKVVKVSFSALDESKKAPLVKNTVRRSDFSKFILLTNKLKPLIEEDTIIEIIAPVLKKGRYKWIGNYDGKPIHFNMKSEEFRQLVQDGKVEFKNGSSINCRLEVRRKISDEGIELIEGYDVIRVNHYFQNNNPVETREGKQHRQTKEAQNNQLKLF